MLSFMTVVRNTFQLFGKFTHFGNKKLFQNVVRI